MLLRATARPSKNSRLASPANYSERRAQRRLAENMWRWTSEPRLPTRADNCGAAFQLPAQRSTVARSRSTTTHREPGQQLFRAASAAKVGRKYVAMDIGTTIA